MDVVAVDVGGTHVRFAIATVAHDRGVRLGETVTFGTADHAYFRLAWERFVATLDRPLPSHAAIAIAGPVRDEVLKLTNNCWEFHPATLARDLGVGRVTLINDFGAVGHAVAQCGPEHFRHIAGPDAPLPQDGPISIIGPGTGLGVAQLLYRDGQTHVIETEGGHMAFAPHDAVEDAILARLRGHHQRVSVERIVSGPGLRAIYESLAEIEGIKPLPHDDASLWAAALGGTDALAEAALDRFCRLLGSVAGDIALVHGATAVVIAGRLATLLADHLPHAGFAERFSAKGRLDRLMAALPVRLLTHPQPSLIGAAAVAAKAAISA